MIFTHTIKYYTFVKISVQIYDIRTKDIKI